MSRSRQAILGVVGLAVVTGIILLQQAHDSDSRQNGKTSDAHSMFTQINELAYEVQTAEQQIVAESLPTTPTPQTSEPPVRHSVSVIVGDVVGLTYPARNEAARSLGNDLLPDECARLLHFLSDTDATGLNPAQLRVVKNEAMNALRRQHALVEPLGDTLASIIADDAQDLWVRDYAIQHLSAWEGLASESEFEKAMVTFQRCLAESDNQIAGTTLIGLDALRSRVGEEAWPTLEDQAFALAQGDAVSPATRVTALQVAARWMPARVLSLAQSITTNPREPFIVRLSAIAVLGDHGGQDSLKVLSQHALNRGSRLQVAAVSALERLNNRLLHTR